MKGMIRFCACNGMVVAQDVPDVTWSSVQFRCEGCGQQIATITGDVTVLTTGLVTAVGIDIAEHFVGETKDPGEYTDLAGEPIIHAAFQGGSITLEGHGCGSCGNAFWTEADDKRRLPRNATVPCPHCGARRTVRDGA